MPLALLTIVGAAGMYFWQRRVANCEQQSIPEATDYQLGHFRTALGQPYSILGQRMLDFYANLSYGNSTLDSDSIDLWVRKQQEYEASHSRGVLRQSYLASSGTLTAASEGGQTGAHEKSHSPNLESPPTLSVHLSESPKRFADEHAPQHARLAQLKSQTYVRTPPGLPILKSILDPGYIQLEEPTDSESIKSNVDVQVLVSSKRKSALRVMNPDQDDTVRQRQPS